MNIKQFIKHIGIFVWYLVTQPMIEISKLFRQSIQKGSQYSYVAAWRVPFLAATILFYIVGNIIMTKLCGAILLILILKTEWNEKKWLVRYRRYERKRAERLLHQQGEQDG